MAVCAAVAAVVLLLRAGPVAFDWKAFQSSLVLLDWWWLVAALALTYAAFAARALRWMVLLLPVKSNPRFSRVFSATAIGFTAAAFFGRAGEMVRPYLVAVKENVPLSSQVAAWVLERIYDMLLSVLVFGWALAAIHGSGVVLGPRLAWVLDYGGRLVAGSAIVLLIMLLLIRHYAEAARKRLLDALGFLPEPRHRQAVRLLDALVKGAASARSDGALVLVAVYSLLEWLLVAVSYWCIAQAYGRFFHLSAMNIVVFMGFITLGSVVQVPGLGGGMQVVAVLVLTELFGIHLELAAGMALLVWLTNSVGIVPAGLLLALHDGLSWRHLRKAGREIES